MQRRYDTANIPIELLRTLVSVADLGTLTKAAHLHRLTQPAVSAQIRRLQQIVGAELVAKSGGGVRLTAYGERVARYARRLLALNDQILLQSGAAAEAHGARIGICAALAPDTLSPLFTALHHATRGDAVQVEHAHADVLAQRLANGYLDIVVLPTTPQSAAAALVLWSEPLAWLCAPDFLLSPGRPIPLIGAAGDTAHRAALAALDAAGQLFALAVAADDWTARLAALRAGFGYVVAPERTAETLIDGRPLKIAREHYLPRLPDLDLGIFARPDLGMSRDSTVIAALARVLQRDGPDATGMRGAVQSARRRNAVHGPSATAVHQTF
jgi:DNA-binding transcriptional LysR family regulator